MDSGDQNNKPKLPRLLLGLLCLFLAGILVASAVATAGLLPPIPKAVAGPIVYQMVNVTFIVALVFALLAFSLFYFLRPEIMARAAAGMSFVAACVVPLTLAPLLTKQGRELSQDFEKSTGIRIADLALFAEQGEARSAVFAELLKLLRLGSFSESDALYESLANGDYRLALKMLREIVRKKSPSNHASDRLDAATASRYIGALVASFDIVRAVEAYTAALELDSNDHVSLYWLGRSRIYVGQFREAKNTFNRLSESGVDLGRPFISARANEGLGRVAQIEGEYVEAERLFRLAQAVYASPETQSECNPKCETLNALMLSKLGETALTANKAPEALAFYERSCEVREMLLGNDQTIAARWSSVSACSNGIGNSYRVQGRFRDAEPFYKRSHSMAKRALFIEPHVSLWLDNVAVSYNRLGTVAAWQGQADTARLYFLASYCIVHALHVRNPENMRWRIQSGARAYGTFSRFVATRSCQGWPPEFRNLHGPYSIRCFMMAAFPGMKGSCLKK